MSKRAEERGLEALPPRWRKTKDGKGRVDGALPVRKFYIRAYEQAEKDIKELIQYKIDSIGNNRERGYWLDAASELADIIDMIDG